MGVNDAIAQEVLYKDTVAQEVLYMNYLSVRPLVLSNTLSHIWDRLNLPMLLFKEGLLTLKLNHLVSKKEGNITNITLNRQVQSPPNSRNPTPATALLPPGEGDTSPQATVHPPREGNSSFNNQASNNNNTTSNSVNSNTVSNQTNSQGPSHNQTPAIAHLPPREGSNNPPGAVQLPSEATSSPHQPRSTTAREENNSSQANSPPATNIPQSYRASQSGHSSNPPRASSQDSRHPPRHQPTQPSPEACATSREGTPSSTPPVGPAKVLLLKNLTLSGSLTCPTNL